MLEGCSECNEMLTAILFYCCALLLRMFIPCALVGDLRHCLRFTQVVIHRRVEDSTSVLWHMRSFMLDYSFQLLETSLAHGTLPLRVYFVVISDALFGNLSFDCNCPVYLEVDDLVLVRFVVGNPFGPSTIS